jgi:flagellin-like hook-associated protein FlgL
MSEISLNAGIRSNLLQLQNSSKLFNQTTERLASGKKVASAIDNPTNFFASVNLTDRASGLTARLDAMGQAVQQIKAADNGVTTIRSFISAMKGVVNSALSETDSNARQDLGEQFNSLINQINTTAQDSGYGGVNLVQDEDGRGETTTVQFNETFDESTLDVKGFNLESGTYDDSAQTVTELTQADFGADITSISMEGYTASATTAQAALVIAGQGDAEAVGVQGYAATEATAATGGNFDWAKDSYKDDLENVVAQLEKFDEALKSQASALANNLATITTREEFTNELVNTLTEGADKLTLADLNEEGANLLALQTSNALATQSLSLASQQSQGVLQLLG